MQLCAGLDRMLSDHIEPGSTGARSLLLLIKAPQNEGEFAKAIGSLRLIGVREGWREIESGLDAGSLSRLNEACLREGATAILLVPHTPATTPDAPYARLWDRTEEFAAAFSAWGSGRGPFPPQLNPGELIRLPI